ncbi:MAG: RNA polymerase subunit sigma-70 [Planctomycetaceae bacterium]|nr:RNA polymerase subunit sigma-70 [Planctomycetaceae bacterium]|tara:strand:- start:766 stop:1416 length:651 start_codon:yes stop_codon:yes gene_type:complete
MSSSTVSRKERDIVGHDSRQMTDEQLLLSYRRTGNNSHFTELEERYRQPLLCFLRRQIGNDSIAEDVLQATFMQLHVKCDQFEEGRKVRPWLYRIAMNQAIDSKRRNRRHENISLNQSTNSVDGQRYELVEMIRGEYPLPEETLQVNEQRQSIRKAVDSLPQSLQTIVSLVFFQGLKYREAAETLSIPVGTLKSRMHSALLQLRSEWPELQFSEAA